MNLRTTALLGPLVVATASLFSYPARAEEPSAPAPALGPAPALAPAEVVRDTAPQPLRWEWARFSTLDYVVTGAAAAVTLGAAIVAPLPRHSLGTISFDESARNALRAGTVNGRYTARDGSDVGLSLTATWPIFIDALTIAWWYRDSRDVAQQMALIDLEALAIAGAFQGVTNVVASRERPYARDCGSADLPSNAGDCTGTVSNRSFFSGHTTFSFTSAALICAHHFQHELLGAPYDALTCGVGYAVATSTAALRVVGDMHFVSDVLTGALVGTIVGYGVPLLHYRRSTLGAADVAGVRLRLVPAAGGAGLSGTF